MFFVVVFLLASSSVIIVCCSTNGCRGYCYVTRLSTFGHASSCSAIVKLTLPFTMMTRLATGMTTTLMQNIHRYRHGPLTSNDLDGLILCFLTLRHHVVQPQSQHHASNCHVHSLAYFKPQSECHQGRQIPTGFVRKTNPNRHRHDDDIGMHDDLHTIDLCLKAIEVETTHPSRCDDEEENEIETITMTR